MAGHATLRNSQLQAWMCPLYVRDTAEAVVCLAWPGCTRLNHPAATQRRKCPSYTCGQLQPKTGTAERLQQEFVTHMATEMTCP